ncbi:GDP-mannose 4,6-dehydratase [Micromonospora sp. RP3T]|uniref:GDP-mannose 4,6-dehydratase n=1 Tax=Micromonospora sp. RP3T TaxID=2135446 RepID=UPI003D756AC6
MDGRQTVLVTGGAGFIGSHLTERLVADGYRVAVVDDFSTGTMQNLEGAWRAGLDPALVFRCDIQHAELVRVLARVSPAVILHLAAQSRVAVSMRDPLHDLRSNVLGSVALLDAARVTGVTRIVLASSGGTVYGAASRPHGATTEAGRRRPLSFYGLSKAVADDYARLYHDHFGLRYVSLALGNVYGPRQPLHGEGGVLGVFARRLVARRPCHVTGDGSAVRDYVHVRDVVEAFVRAIGRGGGTINIGTGVGTSVLDAYQLLAQRVGVIGPPSFVPARPGEVHRIVLDPARARTELGWRPTLSLSDGLSDLIGWVRQVPRAAVGSTQPGR